MSIQDLQQRLDDAERRARERERDRDDEIADLKRRLRDAESRARQAEPELDAKQREIDVGVMYSQSACCTARVGIQAFHRCLFILTLKYIGVVMFQCLSL